MSTVAPADFDYIAALVRDEAAIVIEPSKAYLVESRLSPVARRHGQGSIAEVVTRLRNGDRKLRTEVVEAMTTNETSWYRDVHPFEALHRHIIPELVKRRAQRRQITIWCGAASTGQEPYSVAMLLADRHPELANWNLRIIATDISGEVLGKAMAGRYSQMEVNRGLPAPILAKHFRREGADWVLSDRIRNMVEFRMLNLVGSWPVMPPVDVVFLRNVLIYFDLTSKRAILSRVRGVMQEDGYLFLGAPETTLNLDDAFRRVAFDKTSCYQRNDTGAGR
ncbi:MAG: CheR family methyltransferase [Actinomycetota bacterium]